MKCFFGYAPDYSAVSDSSFNLVLSFRITPATFTLSFKLIDSEMPKLREALQCVQLESIRTFKNSHEHVKTVQSPNSMWHRSNRNLIDVKKHQV
jgi:hypothetical protein